MHDETTPDRPPDEAAVPAEHDGAGGTANEPTTPEVIGVELTAAARDVEVGDPTAMLASVHTTVTRRRRRRNTVVGLAAAGTLVVSGAIVANLVDGGDGDDLIVSAPATEPPTTEPDEAEEVDEVDAPPATVVADAPGDVTEVVTGDPVPVRLVPAEVTDLADPGLSIDAAVAGNSQLLPWQDGYLSVRTTFDPQPLPTELPPEIVDQFPPEVVDLFPDGLPPTIGEATRILQDAGLLDEVSQVITDNPEVSDAIYAEPTPAETTVRFSSDGIEWSDVDAEFPVPGNMWGELRSTGDRLVLVVQPGLGVPDPDAAAEPQYADIYSSTDLVAWDVQQIPLPARPSELGPGESYMPYLGNVAVTDLGFLASLQVSVDVDPMQLLDDETRERVNSSGGGVGVSYGDSGVTIELYDDDAVAGTVPVDGPPEPPTVTETLTYTWEELGLDGPPNRDETSITWVATWGGEPTRVDGSPMSWVIGVGADFVDMGPEPRRSENGIDWTPIVLPTDGYLNSIVETRDGVAIAVSDSRGAQRFHLGDLETGRWTPLDGVDLPSHAYTEQNGSGAFLLASYGEERGDPSLDSVGSRQRAEVDGYLYEFEVTETAEDYSVAYTLTDVASGEVVVSESADGLSAEEDPFEFVVQNDFGANDITIVDPETGEPLVAIPYDAMTREIVNADGSVTDVSEGAIEYAEPMVPRLWVVAPIGDGWIVEQITDGTDGGYEEGHWPTGVVAVDDVVLVAWSDGTFTRIAAI